MLKRAAVVVVFVLSLCMQVSAAQTGTIEVALPGGSLTLYRVDDAFPGWQEPDAETARKLADYAKEQGLSGVTRPVDDTGTVRFGGLEDGIYLLAQWEPGAGYLAVRPFLVALSGETGREIYARPKWERDPDPEIPATGEDGRVLAFPVAVLSFLLLVVWIWWGGGRKKTTAA